MVACPGLSAIRPTTDAAGTAFFVSYSVPVGAESVIPEPGCMAIFHQARGNFTVPMSVMSCYCVCA